MQEDFNALTRNGKLADQDGGLSLAAFEHVMRLELKEYCMRQVVYIFVVICFSKECCMCQVICRYCMGRQEIQQGLGFVICNRFERNHSTDDTFWEGRAKVAMGTKWSFTTTTAAAEITIARMCESIRL